MAGIEKDKYTGGAWRHISHEKDRPKPEVSLAEREKEARALGLSYGVYMAYLETGYLEQYKRIYQKTMFKNALEKGKVNIIPSKIIGGHI